MRKLIIFGVGEQAEIAYYYFKNDSDYEVVAFTADREYCTKKSLFEIPVIAFDELTELYPIGSHHVFIAVGYNQVNKLREEKYLACKAMGYKIASYISKRASVFTDIIGENAFILEDNTIQPFVKIGNNVTLWSGNHIGHHSVIEDHCFITSHVVISGGVTVGQNSFLGVNSTFRDHIKVGSYNVIGAGAIIMSDTEDEAVYIAEKTMPKKIKSSRLKGI